MEVLELAEVESVEVITAAEAPEPVTQAPWDPQSSLDTMDPEWLFDLLMV
ncbi:MAG TPA: hypothetical protein VJ732_14960 [Bryobacteraceae bacterium]|nr:hypothetical protein [Bryobacteraceae bacterium]